MNELGFHISLLKRNVTEGLPMTRDEDVTGLLRTLFGIVSAQKGSISEVPEKDAVRVIRTLLEQLRENPDSFTELQKTTYCRLTQYAILNEPSWFFESNSSEVAQHDGGTVESFSSWLLRQLVDLLSRESIADFHPNMIELLQAFIGSVHEMSTGNSNVNLYKELHYIIATGNGLIVRSSADSMDLDSPRTCETSSLILLSNLFIVIRTSLSGLWQSFSREFTILFLQMTKGVSELAPYRHTPFAMEFVVLYRQLIQMLHTEVDYDAVIHLSLWSCFVELVKDSESYRTKSSEAFKERLCECLNIALDCCKIPEMLLSTLLPLLPISLFSKLNKSFRVTILRGLEYFLLEIPDQVPIPAIQHSLDILVSDDDLQDDVKRMLQTYVSVSKCVNISQNSVEGNLDKATAENSIRLLTRLEGLDVPLVSTAFFQGLVQNAFHSIRLQHHWNTVTPKLINIALLTPNMLSVPGIAKLPELAWMLFSVFRTQLLQESRGATEVMAQARLELKQFFESMPQRSMPMNDPILLSRSLKAILKYPRNDAEKQAWITLLLFELCQDSTLMLSDLGGSVLESLDHSRLFLLSYFSAEIHPHILKRKGFVSCLASGTLGENGLCTHCDKQQETDGMKRVSIESWAFLFQMTLSVDDRIYLLSGLPRMLRHAPSHEVNLATPLFKKLLCNEGLLHENHNVRSAVLESLLVIVTVKHDSLRTDNRISLLGFLSASRKNWSQSVTESMLLSLTAMAIHVPHDITFTSNLLWIVMTELGNENIFLRAVAVEQLRSFASQKTPSIFDGFKPFMEKLSVLLINSLEVNPRIIREFVHLIGIDIKAFIGFGREFILPDLVLSKKSAVLRQVAEWLQQDLHQILLDDAGPILAHVLLNSNGNFDDAMKFYVGSTSLESIPVGKLLKSCLLSLLSKLVLALGDTKKQNMALKVIEFVVFQVQAGASQREPLAAFLLKHLLGIIPPINSILYLKGCLHLTPKLKALLALQKLIMTIGAPIISALPQLTAVIQGVLETSDTRTAALECWRSLISTLDKGALAPFLNQLVVISCQYSEEYDLHQEAIVKDILDYLLVKSAGHFSEQLETIFELPVRFSSFQPQLESTSDDLNWSSELQNDIKWLNHESQPVVRKALEQIRNTLQRNELLVLKSLAGEHVDHTLILLINKLLEVCRRQSDDLILALCCQCLGIVGAVDPGRLEAEKNLNAKCYHVSYAGNAIEFSCYLIRTRLASEYIACSDLSLQSLLAFTIQELLKFIGFSRSMEVVTCLNGVKKISMGGDQSLQSKWDKFSARTMDILTPLLTSRYSIKDTRKVTTPLPIYEYTTCETEWVATLMVHTIQNLSGVSDFHRVLNLVSTLVKESDVNLREDLFPVVVLQGILDVSSNNLDTICQDFLFALEDADQGSKHKRIKTNQAWIKYRTEEIFKQRAAEARRSHRAVDKVTTKDDETDRVRLFLSKISFSVIADASYECGSYARSLLYSELHLRNLQDTKAATDLQPFFSKMQTIYSHLDEPDGIVGISEHINNPSLEQQILEHENLGKWDLALGCHELTLQKDPGSHASIGMLNCMKNLGQLGNVINHTHGILSSSLEMKEGCVTIGLEVSWRLRDWYSFGKINKFPNNSQTFDALVGQVLFAMQQNQNVAIEATMKNLLKSSTSSLMASTLETYERGYDSYINLHIIEELQAIQRIKPLLDSELGFPRLREMFMIWDRRLSLTRPSIKSRELILNVRQSAIDILCSSAIIPTSLQTYLKSHRGQILIDLSKDLIRSGRMDYANITLLHSLDIDAPGARFQRAKWIWKQGQAQQAIAFLRATIDAEKDLTESSSQIQLNQPPLRGKMKLKLAHWMSETQCLNSTAIAYTFNCICKEFPDWEKASYSLGSYINTIYEFDKEKIKQSATNSDAADLQLFNLAFTIVKHFGRALTSGTRYLFQTLPRLLSLWLDMGHRITSLEGKADNVSVTRVQRFYEMHKLIKKLSERLPAWQFATAIPQLVSRICHKNPKVHQVIECIIQGVLALYPQQTFWHLMSVSKSSLKIRADRIASVFSKMKSNPSIGHGESSYLDGLIQEAQKLTQLLINLCNYHVSGRDITLSMSCDFRILHRLAPVRMIVPLQNSMAVQLPSSNSGNDFVSHRPFPSSLPTIARFGDEIEIMNSLQKPRKITIIGSDGKNYIFLCKPKDDLRKDCRLMDFNSLINRLLRKDREARKRRLAVRTYAVIPLNEECGLIEWVPNTVGFRHIILKYYKARNCYLPPIEVKKILDATAAEDLLKVFTDVIIPKHPPVFRDWFLDNFQEPTRWFASRLAYCSTMATMSMVGYVVGLGDRHGENILFDDSCGDCVHVDLNCLFEKGQTFEVPERVPFRLTHNLVDAMGVTGVEGVFRKSCEVTLNVLRKNRESLMSVLETFLYDPLCEWSKGRKNSQLSPECGEAENELALRSLKSIDRKLRGYTLSAQKAGFPLSNEGQVNELIQQATNLENLSRMYIGWAAFM